ncbi:WD40-repeat-containing domain protein [Entophlyctis helioformis]|nr:WD40-repeat-containing domain protein [Entophlyctis helioformis]
MVVTAGDDKRIIVWSIEQWRAIKSIDGHKGIIYQVEFSTDSERIYSSSDDGFVLVWDWKSGAIVNSCMRHPSAIRSFDFNYDRPELVVCGRSDGHVTVWNVQHSLRIDNIMPDPSWMQHTNEENLMAWADKEKNHTGSVLCVRLSPNGRFLATGATDHTCKIWNVTSYRKELDAVQKELQQTEAYIRKLNGYIDVTDPSYDEQLKYQEFSVLKLGETPLSSGYHADLRCTLRHDAPVLCVRFTCNSDITITGSMDATCRLWSSRRGDLLFQINTPAPVTLIQVDLRDFVYMSCQHRLLIFGVKAMFKEDDLPTYWQGPEIKNIVDQIRSNASAGRKSPKSPDLAEPMGLRNVSISELRRLLAHGLVLPRFLETLMEQYKDVDSKQLEINMKRNNLGARHVMRLITNSQFHPHDILKALSSRGNTTVLYSLIAHGSPITGYMLKLGFNQVDEDRDLSMIKIDYRDFQPPAREQNKDRHMPRKPHGDFDYDKWWEGWYKIDQEPDSGSDDEEDAIFQNMLRPQTQPKGKVLHFIPSEQLKLIKDLHANRGVKPIFLRQLAVEGEDGRAFPNFDPQDEVVDQRPVVHRTVLPRQGIRFNEKIIGQGKGSTRRSRISRAARDDDAPQPVPLGEYAAWKGSLSSSRTLFKPERYFQTRGLNLTFENPDILADMILPEPNGYFGRGGLDSGPNARNRSSTIAGSVNGRAGTGRNKGIVFAEPIIIKESEGGNDRTQLAVGSPVMFNDEVIADEDENQS